MKIARKDSSVNNRLKLSDVNNLENTYRNLKKIQNFKL